MPYNVTILTLLEVIYVFISEAIYELELKHMIGDRTCLLLFVTVLIGLELFTIWILSKNIVCRVCHETPVGVNCSCVASELAFTKNVTNSNLHLS